MSTIEVKVLKVDASKRLVFGWGSICKKKNAEGIFEDYVDTDNEMFPEDVTLDAWTEFMSGNRIMDSMHDEEKVGTVVYAFPLTEDIAGALGILNSLDQTGVIVGTRIDNDEVLKKFQNGEFTGYSIGGSAHYEDVPE